ncbi:MAG: CoA transferase [Halioglobus sp.]|nr:CoA transferase [Halioglobus sp.]
MSALSGLRVLELAEGVAGEFCGKLLADFGAEVIKVERPVTGSPTRRLGPFAQRGAEPERSGLFAWLNTNKSSVALDLSDADGREAVNGLLAVVDVVIDDHAPGYLATLGLSAQGYADNWPRLVVCAISPYGADVPDERRHAHDLNVFHASGWGYHTPSGAGDGQVPLKGAGRFIPSYESGLEAALCVMAAVFERDTNGHGRFIDVSMQAVLASRADYVLAQMASGDMPVSGDRRAYDLFGPAGIFACREGFAYIWMSAPAHWEALGKLLNEPDWMREFPDNWLERECTPERVEVVREHIAAWLATQDKHAVSAAAQELGLTVVAVNNASDLEASPQYQHRRFFTAVDHPQQGLAMYPTVPYRLSDTPAGIERAAPLLGQHTDAVLAALDNTQPLGAPDTPAPTSGPLAGVRVVELTKVWAGPYVGKLLAYLGAEVIRIESEGSLDVTRTFGVEDMNNAPGFHAVNPQKLSMQINMKSEEGIAVLLDLIRDSDMVIENLRPGAMARLGLDYATLKAANPAIVYVAMSMYGSEGPLSYQTGYAPCFAALGGLSALVGYPGEAPQGMNIRYADSTFGALAAYAGLVALRHARHTGRGQFVDVSAVESMSSMIGDAVMDFTLNGVIRDCDGNRHEDMVPHGAYPCAGGEWLSIAVADDESWRALAACMGRDELAQDPAYATLASRRERAPGIDAMLAKWTAQSDAGELTAMLQERGVAAARSQSSLDLVADAHLWSRGFYIEVANSAGQGRTTVGPGWSMTRAAQIGRAAPDLGEHTSHLLGSVLGLTQERQKELADAGATR